MTIRRFVYGPAEGAGFGWAVNEGNTSWAQLEPPTTGIDLLALKLARAVTIVTS